jgi:UDP-N-acetylglucosamine 2-epimerase
MSKKRITFIVGARPQFIKSAPVIAELAHKKWADLRFIHTGQHYDTELSSIFFRELKIPRPDVNLHVGSGSHALQTGTIMKRVETELIKERPDLVLVPGDTNTTLGAALASVKLGVPVAHLEAGLRSRDMTMPEEVNRRLTDHCSRLLFAPTKTAAANLKQEGLGNWTYLTGDTMVDSLKQVRHLVRGAKRTVLSRFSLSERNYVLVTLHRPSNVDQQERLAAIFAALNKVAMKFKVIFPAHPRTRLRLQRLGLGKAFGKGGVTLVAPQGYIEILTLIQNSACLITDSGGMQKESFMLHVPCLTLRKVTEWPETLKGDANQLINSVHKIPNAVFSVADDNALRLQIRRLGNPFGDGTASRKVVQIISRQADSIQII